MVHLKKTLLHSAAAMFTLGLCAGLPTGATADSGSDILFIIDGSNSMWGQIDGEAKIDTAKSTMNALIDDVPANSRIGLMTYGTKSKDSCVDYTFLNSVGADRAAVKQSVVGITPRGKTPIDLALTAGITSLQATTPTDRAKSVVLVSDGIETCNGDPCSAAGLASIAKLLGVDIKVHVVGFDLDNEAKSQMQCIADAGGGQYFDAQNPEGFRDAMAAVVETAQAPASEPVVVEVAQAPAPSGPVFTEFFRDDFDSGELNSAHWTVENAKADNFIVDGGELIMISTEQSGFDVNAPTNLITYTGDMPDGDWDATITFRGELNSIADRLSFGLRRDADNFMQTAYRSIDTGTGCLGTRMDMTKKSSGEVDATAINYRTNGNYCYSRMPMGNEAWDIVKAAHETDAVSLTLSKRGRQYSSTVTMAGAVLQDGSPHTITSTTYTSLRSPGTLAFTVDRAPVKFKRGGEVLMMIDSVVINQVSE